MWGPKEVTFDGVVYEVKDLPKVILSSPCGKCGEEERTLDYRDYTYHDKWGRPQERREIFVSCGAAMENERKCVHCKRTSDLSCLPNW